MLIDTHCHLDDEQFDEVRDAVITRALDAGIDFMLTIGTTLESCKKTIEIAEQFASVKAASVSNLTIVQKPTMAIGSKSSN